MESSSRRTRTSLRIPGNNNQLCTPLRNENIPNLKDHSYYCVMYNSQSGLGSSLPQVSCPSSSAYSTLGIIPSSSLPLGRDSTTSTSTPHWETIVASSCPGTSVWNIWGKSASRKTHATFAMTNWQTSGSSPVNIGMSTHKYNFFSFPRRVMSQINSRPILGLRVFTVDPFLIARNVRLTHFPFHVLVDFSGFCSSCADQLDTCPLCRQPIQNKIFLFESSTTWIGHC